MTQQAISQTVSPPLIPRSSTTTESNKTGSWRFLKPRYDEKTAPCSAACPAGEDIARVEMLVAQGLFKEAWETILQENPFPAVCGRVCFHPCERACNRGEFDDPIAIHTLERFVADTAMRYDLQADIARRPVQGPRIAVVGSGPSGLAAAYFLARLGYTCDVFESMGEPGGVLRWGIPPYRLPVHVLEWEIDRIRSLGVEIHCNHRVSADFLRQARDRYQAVFIGCGHHRNVDLGIPGEDLDGVAEGLPFLEQVRAGNLPDLSGRVAVLGGGNTAVDVSRCALRLGAKPVIVYRRRRQDMPAFEHEIAMALEEGVELMELWTPLEITPHPDGYRLVLQRMAVASQEGPRAQVRPAAGQTQELVVSKVFKAIGNAPEESWMQPPEGDARTLRLANTALVELHGGPLVVYGGDLAALEKSVTHAVASGKEAAMALDTYCQQGWDAVESRISQCRVGPGPSLSMEMYLGGDRCRRNPHVVVFQEINTDYFLYAPRLAQPRLLKEERVRDFSEIDLKISAALAIREAERCFNCGVCNQCDNCRLFCPDLAVCRDDNPQGRRIDYDYCKGCGVCVVECPRNAMALE
ncbi:NADPH-dependent glutamate synthase beta chain [Desulfacinum hydrothermale DSM 13146]|uniref:NADPH-dependent glutamate synthase beta chain n=1 Tax=Desulfacinum hydrothermale DSM 13146 TaxID=1121390 RepID=A0A1W1X445_9BACT|nr:FAD-dependent oxidoreductase [Desulfacinum hydrothermale]SMC18675.1 NADPH-dependent glutamate synthase beta chain [Desulfacinum hydrothermale DSM 13146]